VSRSQPWTVPAPSASDPGRATGDTSGYAEIARCTCRHRGEFHLLDEKTGRRKACSVADPTKCPCKTYQPEVSHAADV
jgi:hypothetical protein